MNKQHTLNLISSKRASKSSGQKRTRRKEEGFVFVWAIFLLLGVLFAGFTFLLYALSNVTRLKAQLIALNLATIGSYSSEFDSDESLNNMMMLSNLVGFKGAQAKEGAQAFSHGSLYFKHSLGSQKVNETMAHVSLSRRGIAGLGLGSVRTASFSIGRPAPIYVNLTYDYSTSLVGDSIDQLLQGFGVVDNTGAAPGPNGVDLGGGVIVPTPEIQTAMPFAWDPTYRLLRPWDGITSAWPVVPKLNSVPCTPVQESSNCTTHSSSFDSQRSTIRNLSSDLFMNYKKAIALLTGSIRVTPYVDIDVLCGMPPDETFDNVNSAIDNVTLLPIINNGVCPLWRYDEQDFSGYTLNGEGKIVGIPSVKYSLEEPKNLFADPVNMKPTNILQYSLDLTFYRKLLRYATIYDSDSNVVSAPEQYSKLLDPPLPKMEMQFPVDGFPYKADPPVDSLMYKQVIADPFQPFGWPGRPQPVLAHSGSAYTIQSDLPPEITNPWEYNCTTGPPLTSNSALGHRPFQPGRPLCHIYNQCNPTDQIDCSAPIPLSHLDVYNTPSLSSPNCTGIGQPRCYLEPSLGPALADTAVFCVNGVPRCFGNMNSAHPACTDGTELRCCEQDGTGNCLPYNLQSSPPSPTARNNTPVFRGTVIFPNEAAPVATGRVIHFLNDLSPLIGGTHTHNSVPLDRCKEFKEQVSQQGPQCVWILVTDGVPSPVDSEGNPVLSQEEAMLELQAQVDEFTGIVGGRIFTWYLGTGQSGSNEIFEEFKQIMTGPNRVFIESSVTASADGIELSEEFLQGLRNLLSALKREVNFQL